MLSKQEYKKREDKNYKLRSIEDNLEQDNKKKSAKSFITINDSSL